MDKNKRKKFSRRRKNWNKNIRKTKNNQEIDMYVENVWDCCCCCDFHIVLLQVGLEGRKEGRESDTHTHTGREKEILLGGGTRNVGESSHELLHLLSLSLSHTHTHTHTHIYIYIYTSYISYTCLERKGTTQTPNEQTRTRIIWYAWQCVHHNSLLTLTGYLDMNLHPAATWKIG